LENAPIVLRLISPQRVHLWKGSRAVGSAVAGGASTRIFQLRLSGACVISGRPLRVESFGASVGQLEARRVPERREWTGHEAVQERGRGGHGCCRRLETAPAPQGPVHAFVGCQARGFHRKRGEEEPVVRGVCTRRRIGPDHRGLGDHETRGLRIRQIAPGEGVQQRRGAPNSVYRARVLLARHPHVFSRANNDRI